MSGNKKIGPGRPPGSKNKVTKDVRETFEELMRKSMPKMNAWLNRVAKDDPAKALDLMVKFSEFVIPKLNKVGIEGNLNVTDVKIVEITGEGEQEHGPRKLAVNDD